MWLSDTEGQFETRIAPSDHVTINKEMLRATSPNEEGAHYLHTARSTQEFTSWNEFKTA